MTLCKEKLMKFTYGALKEYNTPDKKNSQSEDEMKGGRKENREGSNAYVKR